MADDVAQDTPPPDDLPTSPPEELTTSPSDKLPASPPEELTTLPPAVLAEMEHELIYGSGAVIADEPEALETFERIKKLALVQAIIISIVTLFLVLEIPFTRPIYYYNAMSPDKKLSSLYGLDTPNMTNRAILAWATTSITEVLTMGFGDMDVRLPDQENKFTKKGWEEFLKLFRKLDAYTTFKQSQLVLTTVPSNTPVIIRQGMNFDKEYQWNVQMPIIMTYATNNNVMQRENRIVTLEIVRVPTYMNPWGIGIKNWIMY